MSPSTIEWTEETWNPTTGCDRCSPGCDHCYALTLAKRLKGMGQAKYQRDGDPITSGPGFGLTEHPAALTVPLTWRRPRLVFVNSMSDLFHPKVSQAFIGSVFAVMAEAHQHTFQVLTKRPHRMAGLDLYRLALEQSSVANPKNRLGPNWQVSPFRNVWLGTSIENDKYAWRAGHLRRTPAAVRFLSCEPLLGPLPSLDLTGIDWLIAGGESGPGARPCHPDWVRDLRDRCVAAGVAFFFKQWGAWAPQEEVRLPARGEVMIASQLFRRVGKAAAGRELDGRTWDEMPERAA